ncbi:MAG TPA: putative PEP-binding protein [Trichocoleus sp.]
MFPFRQLAQIADADLAEVGEKAKALGHLRRMGLPVAEGGVLLAQAWQQCLDELALETQGATDLRRLALNQLPQLQQTAATLRQAFLSRPLEPFLEPLDVDATTLLADVQSPWLMLRPSLLVVPSPPLPPPAAADLQGLITARICAAQSDAIAVELKLLWAETLRAYNLVVWRQHCHSLQQVRLATLVQPLYPAEISGTLTLSETTCVLEVVLGLGLVLSQGEAIPARCRWASLQPGRFSWQPGYQERIYQVRQGVSGKVMGPLRVNHREQPELVNPLTRDQLLELQQLGQQVQQQSAGPLQLEWLIYTPAPAQPPRLIITQVTQRPATSAAPGTAQAKPSPGEDALLPLVKGVVQGIGAASGRALAPAVVLKTGSLARDLSLPPGCIVVLPDLQPEMCVRLQGVAGIVTVRGGATCHAAILARELNIPAVVGAPQATELLATGDALWLDGDRGIVYLLPEDQAARPLFQSQLHPQLSQPALQQSALSSKRVGFPSSPHHAPTATGVMVNLSQVQRLADLPLDNLDGVGLLRSEWLLIDVLEGRHPQQWVAQGYGAELQAHLVAKLAPLLAAVAPKPVRYRSLDLRSHEWISLVGSPPIEPNPILGIRGTFSYQLDPRLFKIELAALAELQRQGHTNLQLMLPFVRTVEEFSLCRQWVEQARLLQVPSFQLWIMAEVPSVLFLLPAYRQAGVQGVAIGSNDLTQLLLAVDRDQPIMASAYDERHPAVVAALAHLVQTARQQGLACSICGQAPVRYPELIDALVQWGISSISVEPGALAATRSAVLAAEGRQHLR